MIWRRWQVPGQAPRLGLVSYLVLFFALCVVFLHAYELYLSLIRNHPTVLSRLVICQGDGKMESVLDNGHFVRSKFGRDAGFWRLYN